MRRPGLTACLLVLACAAPASAGTNEPAWKNAWQKPPMTVAETRVFMKRLAAFALAHHLKRDEKSPQRGMMYEYFWVANRGTPRQWIQGEALDTMHDGAWFAAAMCAAARATGDPLYRDTLVTWQLPFYLKMLNHGDALFTAARNDGRPGDDRGWRGSKEWLLQGREKGFVPYWWDDGASVSLEMIGRKDQDEHVNFAARNEIAGPNPDKKLSGYSLGSSNHLAQDLAVMLQAAWMLLHQSTGPAEKKLCAEIAEAAKNLQECRARHGYNAIPAVRAALAATSGDGKIRASLPEETWKTVATARNDWRRATREFKPDEPVGIPGFADDQAYRYYIAIARDGAPSDPVAFRLAYDAFTLPLLYRMYCDDEPSAPGINVFDLHPYKFVNGSPADYRSQRKGPGGQPRPVGSRFGPQNMAVSGWALQALKAKPGLYDRAKSEITATNFFPDASASEVVAALARELGGGLRTWEAIFNEYGYIPTGIGAGRPNAEVAWDGLSDTGGYAHLIAACAQWILHLEGKCDWEVR